MLLFWIVNVRQLFDATLNKNDVDESVSGIAGCGAYDRFRWGMVSMKKHKFWAWAMVFCAFMTMYTGHKKA